MDILINGMEMPKYCRGCPFEVSSIYGQKCCITRKFTRLNDNEDGMKRHIACPLVALPEHGRLIDADRLKDRYINSFTWNKIVMPILDCEPTVLEANNGTDN